MEKIQKTDDVENSVETSAETSAEKAGARSEDETNQPHLDAAHGHALVKAHALLILHI